MRGLAVTGAQRVAALPDLPTTGRLIEKDRARGAKSIAERGITID